MRPCVSKGVRRGDAVPENRPRRGRLSSNLPRRQFAVAEEAAGTPDQHDREQQIDGEVALLDRQGGRPDRLEAGDEQPAQRGARHRADAAEDGGDQRLEPERESAGEPHAAIDHGDDDARHAAERAGDDDGDVAYRARIDPEERRRAFVFGDRPPGPPVGGAADELHETERRPEPHQRQECGERVQRHDERSGMGKREGGVEDRRQPAQLRPLCEAQIFGQGDREANRCDQNLLAAGALEMAQHEAPHREAMERRDQDRDREGDRKARDRSRDRQRQQQRDADNRGQCAKCRELPEAEDDPSGQPVDEGVGRREQAIDCRRGQAAEALLQAVGEAGRKRREVLGRCGSGIGRGFVAVLEVEAAQEIEAGPCHRAPVRGDADQCRPPEPVAFRSEQAVDAALPCDAVSELHAVEQAQRPRHRSGRHTLDLDMGARRIERRDRLPAQPRLVCVETLAAAGEADEHKSQNRQKERAHANQTVALARAV